MAVAVLALCSGAASAATVSWNVDTDGFWDVGTNWSTGMVPQAGDDVVINRPSANVTVTFRTGTVSMNSLTSTENFAVSGGILTLATASALANLAQSGGQLAGDGTVTISGPFTWTGGIMTGTGITNANGGIAISGNTVSLRAGRTLNNAATANWTGIGGISNDPNTTFNNPSGATFSIATAADFSGGTINNGGTIDKTSGGGDGITRIAATLSNSNTVTVSSGVLELDSGGTHTGSFTVANAAALELGGGTHTVSAPSSIGGAGSMRFAGGTTNFNAGTYAITGSTECNGGTHTFAASVNVTAVGAISITNGTLDFSSGEALTTPTYTQSAGTLAGSDTITVTGLLTWSGGTMGGQGVTNANGGIQLSQTSSVGLRNIRTLNSAAMTTWTGAGSFSNDPGATFNNLMGATLLMQTTADFFGGTLNNAGALTKVSGGGDGRSVVSGTLNNSGTVTVMSGVLELDSGGSHSGPFTVDAAAILEFGGGTHTAAAGTGVSGMGHVRFAGGTTNFNAGTYAITGTTECTGGTHTFASGSTVSATGMLEISSGTLDFSSGDLITTPAYSQSSGFLAGSDTVQVTGVVAWSGGTMRGLGITNANGGIMLANTSTVSLRDTRTLNNAGTATFIGSGSISNDAGATFNNLTNASFLIQTSGDFFGGTLNNAGTIVKSSGGGDGITRVTATVNNTGSVSVTTGALQFENGGTHSGNFSVADTASLGFNGGTHNLNGSEISGAGRVRFTAGITSFNSGTYEITGITECAGGTHTFLDTATISALGAVELIGGTLDLDGGEAVVATAYTQSAGILDGSATVDVGGVLVWSGGTMRGQGATNANGGMQLTNAGSVSLRETRILNNAAMATWTGAGSFNNDTGAVLNNLASGTLAIQTTGDFFNGTLNNLGTLTKSSGGGDGITRMSGALNNSGTVEVLGGTLRLESSYTQSDGETRLNGGAIDKLTSPPLVIDGGLLTGVGTIDGNVRVAGTLAPGLSAGELEIDGTYEQTSTGVLAVEIGGLTPEAEFDRLTVTGNATLAGTVDVALIDGFVPSVGNIFRVMTQATASGDFDGLSGVPGFTRMTTSTFTDLQFTGLAGDTPTPALTSTATVSTSTPTLTAPATATAVPTNTAPATATAVPTSTAPSTPTTSPLATSTPAGPTATPTPTSTEVGTATATQSPGFTVTRTVLPLPIAPVAAGEFGGDGAVDLVAGDSSAPKLVLLRNSGQASFTLADDALLANGIGGLADVVVGDLDGDGSLDAVAANPGGELVGVALGNGQHELGDPQTVDVNAMPLRLAVGEVTGDDDLDVVAATTDRILVLRGGGDGGLSLAGEITTNAQAADLIVGDFNGDGDGDVLAALPDRNLVALYPGDGTGGFGTGPSVSGNAPRALVLGSFTGNAMPDLAVANANSVAVYPPVSGGFASTPIVTAGVIASRLFAAEVTGDSFLDLIAVDFDTGMARALPGDGSGGFGDDPNFAVDLGIPLGGADFADLNNDTAIDLVMTDPATQELLIALNRLPAPTPTPTMRPTCVGDCNDDGNVSINELITGVNIAIRNFTIDRCPQFDANGNLQVDVSELIRGVNNDLRGCFPP